MRQVSLISALILFIVNVSFSSLLTVSKSSSAQFSMLQDAVDAAREGDTVEIIGTDVYEEQVTISKNKILLRSRNPSAELKPVIRWQDTENFGPTTCAEAKDSTQVTFDHNGALRVNGCQEVIIEGLCIDGVSPIVRSYQNIWDGQVPCMNPHSFGSVGINIRSSGSIIVRYCEVINTFFGIYVKDRNVGGVNAPKTVSVDNGIPLSLFGKMGNHLIERNRIHANSFGLMFDDLWDLGSTVRYNLFYSNYHQSTAIINTVMAFPSGTGRHFPGGALFFRDVIFSPVAIYNNTFWNNYLFYCANWKVGGQHLAFNNIMGEPKYPWSNGYPGEQFRSTDWLCLSGKGLPCRTMNSTFSSMLNHILRGQFSWIPYCKNNERCSLSFNYDNSVMISMDISTVRSKDTTFQLRCRHDSIYQISVSHPCFQGAPIYHSSLPSKASFSQKANASWLETDSIFTCFDEDSSNFLEPDWISHNATFLRNKGWQEIGIRDADGLVADIGAAQKQGIPQTLVRIRPTAPVTIAGTEARVQFRLESLYGNITNPRIKFLRFVKNVPIVGEGSLGAKTIIPDSDMVLIDIPDAPVNVGVSTLNLNVPERLPKQDYAFFEMTIEGTGPNGIPVTSDVGFLPYRKQAGRIVVEIWDENMDQKKRSVKVGEPVNLKVSVYKNGDTLSTTELKDIEIKLASGYSLKNGTGEPLSISSITGSLTETIMFTEIPENINDVVNVTGTYSVNDTINMLWGFTDAVSVNRGDNVSGYDWVKRIDAKKPVTLQIFDLRGRSVLKVNGRKDLNEISDVKSKIPSGAYIIRLEQDGCLIKSSKQMLNR